MWDLTGDLSLIWAHVYAFITLTCIKESPTSLFHIHPPDDRPGAHGAVGAALATPTFSPKMGVSNMWVYLMSFIVVFNHCMNFLLCNCM